MGPVRVQPSPVSHWHNAIPNADFSQQKLNPISDLAKKIPELTPTSKGTIVNKAAEFKSFQLQIGVNKDLILLIYTKHTKQSIDAIKVTINQINNDIKCKPHDISFRSQRVELALNTADVFKGANKLEEENKYLDRANHDAQECKKINYFDAKTHYAFYLIQVYQGINAKDMNSVKDGLLSLSRAKELDPSNEKITQLIATTTELLKARWIEMKDQKDIDADTYLILGNQLEQILAMDPFKEEFKNNPDLFKSMPKAPKEFLASHPHLTSINAFLKKYPSEGYIRLPNNTYSMENLKAAFLAAKADPFATGINLILDEAVLTPKAADLIEKFMLDNPKISIFLGNEDDGDTLVTAFKKDQKIVSNSGELKCTTGNFEDNNKDAYRYFIDPSSVKK
jgi:hypothetical protein